MSATSWRSRFLRQRVWFLIALLCLTTLLYLSAVFWRTDLEIFDTALPTGPAPNDVLIVAIDEASIAALGRWPWSRAVHASLLDRLRGDGARAVALDILFTEPDPNSPEGDIALARAMERGPPTVIPLLADLRGSSQIPRERLPIPILAQAAAGLGHADLEVDPDGIVRSVFLREGPGAATREYLAAALLEHTPGADPIHLRGERHPEVPSSPTAWVRDYRVLIPFLGPPGHFTQVSYIDVLRGDVSPTAVMGKWVLVGMTAQGLVEGAATPRSGQSQPMPGVEVSATVLQALKSGTTISRVSMPITILLGLIPVALAGIGLQRLAPGRSLLLTTALVIATLACSVLLLRGAGWWWPPTASLAVLLAAYPLWSWQRLEATQTFLEEELRQLARESFPLLPDLPQTSKPTRSDDFLQRRIGLLQQATQRLRSARSLFAGTIDALPDATILVDTQGQIVLVNPAARALFGSSDNRPLEGTAVDELFSRRAPGQLQFASLSGRTPCTVETVLTETGRHCLVRAVAFHDEPGVRAGTIIDVADVTELRAAQREREDVLRFLSHDMKSPATSLLGLAQLQRDPARALGHEELSQRLDVLAHRVLTLVDSFVALARAESADPAKFDHFDLRDAVQDAYDEVWAAAQAREIAIAPSVSEEACMINGDRQLLARAIINLLSNAIKFSVPGSGVGLLCENVAGNAVVSIVDHGAGIEPEHRAELFQRFSRGLHRGTDPGGAGLGLAFVRVVAEKHRGAAWAEHERERETVFRVSVPLAGGEPGDLSRS
jgi:PAS domain S-box-containing protein